jgi:hypothetical protein
VDEVHLTAGYMKHRELSICTILKLQAINENTSILTSFRPRQCLEVSNRQGAKMYLGIESEKSKKKPTAPGVPRRSPIQVLPWPDGA